MNLENERAKYILKTQTEAGKDNRKKKRSRQRSRYVDGFPEKDPKVFWIPKMGAGSHGPDGSLNLCAMAETGLNRAKNAVKMSGDCLVFAVFVFIMFVGFWGFKFFQNG